MTGSLCLSQNIFIKGLKLWEEIVFSRHLLYCSNQVESWHLYPNMVSFSNILFVEPSELLKDHMVDPLARGFFFFFFFFFWNICTIMVQAETWCETNASYVHYNTIALLALPYQRIFKLEIFKLSVWKRWMLECGRIYWLRKKKMYHPSPFHPPCGMAERLRWAMPAIAGGGVAGMQVHGCGSRGTTKAGKHGS